MPEIKSQASDQESSAFQLKVHHRDRKGLLLDKTPYTLFVKQGVQYFERPVNSGNLFYENMEPAGRVERITDEKGVISPKFDFDAEHIDYVAPLKGHELMAAELDMAKSQNEALQRELAAIKKEQAASKALKIEGTSESHPAQPDDGPAQPAVDPAADAAESAKRQAENEAKQERAIEKNAPAAPEKPQIPTLKKG